MLNSHVDNIVRIRNAFGISHQDRITKIGWYAPAGEYILHVRSKHEYYSREAKTHL